MDWHRLLPLYWLQNEPTDQGWDQALNMLLNKHEPEVGNGPHTVTIGGVEVWIGNWPYAYGKAYGKHSSGLPTVVTRKRLRKAVDAARLRHFMALAS